MNQFDLLQKYLANTAVLNIKMHNLHWNVVGPQFIEIHNFTEDLYDQLFEDFDEVAELLKMKEEMPLSTMAEYLEESTIEEVKAQDFNLQQSLEILINDMEIMQKLATEIRNISDEKNDFETVAIFEEYISFYSKNLWFVRSMAK